MTLVVVRHTRRAKHMHLDNYEIQKIGTNFNVLWGSSNDPYSLSKEEINSLSNIREMEFEIWYNHV